MNDLPPSSTEAEQSVLGAMMINPRCVDDVSSILLADDFYRADHKKTYAAILELSAAGDPVDVVTVDEKLGGDVGLSYLGMLAKNTPNTSNVLGYARIIRKHAKSRSIIQICQDAIGKAYEQSPDQVANTLGNALDSIETVTNETASNMTEVAKQALSELEARHKSESRLIGFSTGLHDLDNKTGGLVKGSLVVIGGRPSMGKTAFALQIIDNRLATGGSGVFFSMEMGKTELFNRQLASKSQVPLGLIRQPKEMSRDQWSKITPACGKLVDYKLIIDDQSGLHLNQIRARARAHKRKMGGLDFIVVDYLTLMNLGEGSDRVNQIGEITKGLKNLARDLDICVILLAQLNRSLESRPNKRPVMSDLRDSGAIEQDADVIMFLYRDEVYNPNTEHAGVAEIGLAKQRNAATGTVRAVFRGDVQRFEDHAVIYGQFHQGAQ